MELINIQIPVPKEILTLLNTTPYELAEESKATLLIDFYKSGRLSSGKCAEALGCTKEEFFKMLGRRGLSYLNWDEDDSEIANEINETKINYRE